MNKPKIPYIPVQQALPKEVELFLDFLTSHGFQGDIACDQARRLIAATDNSVYQLMPQAILYPKTVQDIELVMKGLSEERFRTLKLTPRGGGTGTNGQSLNTGLCLDLSRYLRSVLKVNLDEAWIEVEAGVVLDQLNQGLKKDEIFFAPNLSPSSRATIGGMINTDAAGKGSRIYGKTSDHVLGLELVTWGGERLWLEEMSMQALHDRGQEETVHNQAGFYQTIALPILDLVQQEKDLIEQVFPKLSRFMTGYNLKMLFDAQRNTFDLTRLIAGSEGTLGVVTKARLKLTPLPKVRQLILFSYGSFQDALGSAKLLLAQKPSAIETIDHNILSLARNDISYHEVKDALEGSGIPPGKVSAINLVEFEGRDLKEITQRVQACLAQIRPQYGQANTPIADFVAIDEKTQQSLWNLRKKGVGLLAARPGKRKPIAFVEDTVVPPENLSAYIKEFTALLDREGVEYGLFGHVDVGCLHVRPALDLRNPDDEARFIRISDQVSSLVKSYGGLIWGEHGKGIRSAYSPDYFGELYPYLQKVKALFDPYNQLNPGKVATPNQNYELLPLASPLRAHHDRKILAHNLHNLEASVTCNGNGQCFDYHQDHLMCPSARVTRDRLHSPKGRAGVMRAWLAALSEAGFEISAQVLDPKQIRVKRGVVRGLDLLQRAITFPFKYASKLMHQAQRSHDFSSQVHEAMHGCLSCKACTTACPVKVDVPSFKSRFLDLFYTRYPRPLRDYLIGALESLASIASHAPMIWNGSLRLPMVSWFNKKIIGLVDPPKLSKKSALKVIQKLGGEMATPKKLANLSQQERKKSVIIIPDAFNAFFDADTLVHSFEVLKQLGFKPYLAPFKVNGKGLHVKGRLAAFKRVAEDHYKGLKSLADCGVPLVVIDPAVALTYRDEYPEFLGANYSLKVWLIQEWLSTQLAHIPQNIAVSEDTLSIFGHCTERSLVTTAVDDWQRIFKHLGISSVAEEVACCGMCGVYGHEAEHEQLSKELFQSSWALKLADAQQAHRKAVVTGYSCRSQIKRCQVVNRAVQVKQNNALHPMSELYFRLRKS